MIERAARGMRAYAEAQASVVISAGEVTGTVKGTKMTNETQETSAASDRTAKARRADAGIVTVRPSAETLSRQRLPYFVGISEATAGAKGLSMSLIIIPPGGAAEPHLHRGYETAIFILKGRVKTLYGPGLREETVNETGDFAFIPPDVPHQPVNLSMTEAAQAIVARNDPNEQESVVLYDPEKDR
jgi:uncharacterized RmlC-like cupin family protein